MNSAEYLIKLIGKIFVWLVIIPIGLVIALLNEANPDSCTAKPTSFITAGTPVPCWLATAFSMDVVRVRKEEHVR